MTTSVPRCVDCRAPKPSAAPGVVCEQCGAVATLIAGPTYTGPDRRVPRPDETRLPQPPYGCAAILLASIVSAAVVLAAVVRWFT